MLYDNITGWQPFGLARQNVEHWNYFTPKNCLDHFGWGHWLVHCSSLQLNLHWRTFDISNCFGRSNCSWWSKSGAWSVWPSFLTPPAVHCTLPCLGFGGALAELAVGLSMVVPPKHTKTLQQNWGLGRAVWCRATAMKNFTHGLRLTGRS